MPSARKADLLHRRIVAVDWRPFENGHGELTHDPVLTLDDGSTLHFVVEETESLDYGVRIVVTKRQKEDK